MASPFVQVEVLGPRVSLERWLAVLQDHGGCHLADALRRLEGEPGIGRPVPTPDEWEGWIRRDEAARALRAVVRILPPSAPGEDPGDRPAWSVGTRGEDRDELASLCTRAQEAAACLASALEAARAAEAELAEREAERLALRGLSRLASGEAAEVAGSAWALPVDTGRPRKHVRRLRRAGLSATSEEGRTEVVLVARGNLETPEGEAAAAFVAREARAVPYPSDVAGRPLDEAVALVDGRLTEARRRAETAMGTLREAVDEHGPGARHLLDALEDAETREAARQRLIASERVVAARVFVRREEEADLRRRLSIAFGSEVVVRDLGPASDAPSLPRAVAGLPLAALDGLRLARFGEVSTPALLALSLPLIVGATAADFGVGLVLLVVGGLLGIGAPPGSPRRDTGLLAQIGGLISLLLGVVDGRAFGSTGETWFGSGWGLLGSDTWVAALDPLHGVMIRLGAVAWLLAIWGAVAVVWNLRRERPTRVLGAAVGAASFMAVGGVAALAVPSDPVRWLWLAAPLGAVLVVVLAGLRGGLVRLVLDGVGVFRLVAIAALALVAFDWAFTLLLEPTFTRVAVAPAILGIAALAVAVDAAHVAMGVPYDLSLASGALAEPFAPFARRFVPRGGSRPS